MALSIEKVIHNLHFDRLFLDKIEAAERTSGKKLHANGIPFHYIAVFKTLLCMKEADMTPEQVAKNYTNQHGTKLSSLL